MKLNFNVGLIDNKIIYFIMLGMTFFISGCSDKSVTSINDPNTTGTGRWYTKQQVIEGKKIYLVNCISCHNKNAVGTFNWKKKLVDGSYPPPPLNGTAHAWHHPMPALLKTISEGGINIGGKMPAFKGVINDDGMIAVVAYFQHYWGDEIYDRWYKSNQK